MLTAKKRVRPLPTHRMALRYPADCSSSDQFISNDSSQDSQSDSLPETSSDACLDSSSDSSSRHSSSVHGALSPVCANLSPPPKRIRDSDSVIDLEVSSEEAHDLYVPREVSLGVNVKDNYEPYTYLDVDSDVQVDIVKCIMYADAIRARGTNDRNVVETATVEEVESSARGMIEVEVDSSVRPVINDDVCKSVREGVLDHVTSNGALEMVLEEEDKVEKYIGGLPDNIQGNVIVVEPTRLQDAICVANNLIDQKLKGYAIKNAENKRRFDNNQRDNRGQQQPFKRQNVNGSNVPKAYTVENNVEGKGYTGALPYFSKCRLHHERPLSHP
nr:reverse transcriptase domain-containing protein [Tanacetum cinerariifolium]